MQPLISLHIAFCEVCIPSDKLFTLQSTFSDVLHFLFVYGLINVVVDVKWLQHRFSVFDKHGEHFCMLSMLLSSVNLSVFNVSSFY